MTAFLPPSLLALFAPRPPLPYIAPPAKKHGPTYTGVSTLLSEFKEEVAKPAEAPMRARQRRVKELMGKHEAELEEAAKGWDPQKAQGITENPYKTLLVGRLSYETTESKLRREFEAYGPILAVHVVADKQGKPRGYAFIEFERERDMKMAYQKADGKKIDGRRIVVDVERGRTMKQFRPRRLGGGLGNSRVARAKGEKGPGREVDGAAGGSSSATSYRPRSDAPASSARLGDRSGDRDRGVVGASAATAASGGAGGSGGSSGRPAERSDRDKDRDRDRDRDRDYRDKDRERDRDRDRDRDGGERRPSSSHGDRDRERDRYSADRRERDRDAR